MICPRCKNEIDPEVCWCGDPIKGHGYSEHSPVPMGCDCGRVKPEDLECQPFHTGTGVVGPKIKRLHTIPIGDHEVHCAQPTCWCFPALIVKDAHTRAEIWTHNAKDCREAKERQTGEKCSEGWVTIAEIL